MAFGGASHRTTKTPQTQLTSTLEHPHFGKLKGSGWLTPETIVQYFYSPDKNCWSLENLHPQSLDRYHISRLVMEGQTMHRLISGTLSKYLVG